MELKWYLESVNVQATCIDAIFGVVCGTINNKIAFFILVALLVTIYQLITCQLFLSQRCEISILQRVRISKK